MSPQVDLERRDAIRSAARQLFFQFGFSKTSMEDIARQSGLAKASIYYYYTNKEAIFHEVVLEEAQGFLSEIINNLPQDAPADEKLKAFIALSYQELKVFAEKMADVPLHYCEHSPHGAPMIRELDEFFRREMAILIEEGNRSGIWTHDADTISQTVIFMTEFLNHAWMRSFPEELRDRVIETMIDIILNGLRRRNI